MKASARSAELVADIDAVLRETTDLTLAVQQRRTAEAVDRVLQTASPGINGYLDYEVITAVVGFVGAPFACGGQDGCRDETGTEDSFCPLDEISEFYSNYDVINLEGRERLTALRRVYSPYNVERIAALQGRPIAEDLRFWKQAAGRVEKLERGLPEGTRGVSR